MNASKPRGSKTFSIKLLTLISLISQATALSAFGQSPTPTVDRRADALHDVEITQERQRAATLLQTRVPAVRIDYDNITGAPSWISSQEGFLSNPSTEDEVVPKTAQVAPKVGEDPYRPIKRFVGENSVLFGHGIEVLADAVLTQDYVTAHNGMRTVVWQQKLDGIPVFEGKFIGHITKRGELVSVSSHFLPDVARSSGLDVASRLNLANAPPVPARQAVANALADIGFTVRVDDISPVGTSTPGPERRQVFSAAPLIDDARSSLVWLPISRTSARLCWAVRLVGNLEDFLSLVDATSGQVLVRRNQTCNYTDVTYRVFAGPSPSPGSPGLGVPGSNQGYDLTTPGIEYMNRPLITISALSPSASPNGWINDGNNQTIGNNVDASLNRTPERPINTTPRPQGSAFRVFDFPIDFGQEPDTYETASVVNLFYWCNWMHDKLYDLGFTEAAGNFQSNNFGRGGAPGADPILAYAQYGVTAGVRNGAKFIAFPDGQSGELWVELYNGSTPGRDSALDSEIICHEYTHGLSTRLVGHDAGIDQTKPQTLGLGEGWSDFYALALLNSPNNNVHANFPIFSYVGYNMEGASGNFFDRNYYYGLRRYPYSTVSTVNPLTFKDISPSQADPHSTVPHSSLYDPNPPYNFFPYYSVLIPNADEPHNVGEVWCVTLWEARANLIDHYGWQIGNDLILRLVTDGMNLSPANPNFIQARDAILQADMVDTGGANLNLLWTAFARRGMGYGATAPASSTTSPVVESFAAPPTGSQIWTYTTGNAVFSSPAVGADGSLYFGSTDGYLYALNSNGQLKWSFTESAQYVSFNAAPAVGGDGTIYARRNNGYLYAMNPSGTLKWKTQIYYDTWTAPALGPDGTVYVAGEDPAHNYAYCIHAIRPSDGVILWSFDAGNTIYSGPVIGPQGTIYFGSTDGKVYAVNPGTHQLIPGWPVVTGGWVISSPTIARDGTIYVGSYDGKLYALNPNGSYKWSPLLLGTGGIDSSPAIGPDGSIYIGSWNYKVYSVNPNTGQINPGWPFTTGLQVRSSPAVGADGTVFVGSDDGKLYALHPDGTSVGAPWPFNTGGAVFSSPVIAPMPGDTTRSVVYVGSGNGKLYALSSVSGLAHSDWPMYRRNPWHTGNPSTLTVSSGSRLIDKTFQFQINGLNGMNCSVEGSENLEEWTGLGSVILPGSGTAIFSDVQAAGYPYRFYRARSDSILSYNSLGYVAVNEPAGTSMVANQLDNPGGNTVAIIMANAPDGAILNKWNEATQQYDNNTFVAGYGWTSPTMTINPGEGALVQLGSATIFTFVGTLRQGTISNPFPSGLSVRSSIAPQAGPIDSLLGFVPISGDSVYRYNNAAGAYDIYNYSGGVWSPSVPTPLVGESVWINTPSARTWTRVFSVW